MRIVLVGLMGSGKSTVGRIIADRLGYPLIDSDTAIEDRTGSSVRELWEDGGEVAYRQLESDVVLTALASDSPAVIAAPGGVVMDAEVRAALTGAFVVWLLGDPSLLATRVRHGDHRPLLGNDPQAVLAQMAEQRAELYGQVADLTLHVDEIDAGRLADQVLDALPIQHHNRE